MAYTAIGLRGKTGLSLSQQSSEQITQRFTQYENNSIKQISLFVTHFWSCPPCFFWRSHIYQHCDFLLGLLQFLYLHCSIWPHPGLQTLMLFQHTLYLLPLHPRHRHMFHAVSLYPLLPLLLPDSLRVLQWNARDLRASSTERLHFLSFHSVDLICIQKSNFNSPSCFRIPKFSALRSDRTHSGSGIFLLISHTLAAASSFSSGRAYPSLSFLPPLFLRFTLTLIM